MVTAGMEACARGGGVSWPANPGFKQDTLMEAAKRVARRAPVGKRGAGAVRVGAATHAAPQKPSVLGAAFRRAADAAGLQVSVTRRLGIRGAGAFFKQHLAYHEAGIAHPASARGAHLGQRRDPVTGRRRAQRRPEAGVRRGRGGTGRGGRCRKQGHGGKGGARRSPGLQDCHDKRFHLGGHHHLPLTGSSAAHRSRAHRPGRRRAGRRCV
jgi:hypothetical protein